MIIAKTILFFFGLIFTFSFLGDFILRIIMRSKEDADELHQDFVHGYATIINASKISWMILTWTAFYVSCQVS